MVRKFYYIYSKNFFLSIEEMNKKVKLRNKIISKKKILKKILFYFSYF
jgi:hypothetical protein